MIFVAICPNCKARFCVRVESDLTPMAIGRIDDSWCSVTEENETPGPPFVNVSDVKEWRPFNGRFE